MKSKYKNHYRQFNYSWVIFMVFVLITILYEFSIIAMHYVFGVISYIILFVAFLISVIKKINIPYKQFFTLIASLFILIAVFVTHFIISKYPFLYKYDYTEEGIEITGYKYIISNDYGEYYIEIPSEIRGKKVTSIGKRAFYGSKYIKNLKIPEGIEVIKEQAFEFVDYEVLTFPSSLKRIEDHAFRQVSFSAGYVILPSSLEYIGQEAFLFGIRAIIVPSDLNTKKWEENWSYFGVCYDVINVQNIDNVIYALKSNGTATVVNIDNKCLDAKILEKVEFNNQDYPVTTIGEYAGSYCIFENIVIPNSIELIKKEAFCYNRSIRSIYIPSSVTIMEQDVFRGCTRLTINVEHSEKPKGWTDEWNLDNNSVNWNVSNE